MNLDWTPEQKTLREATRGMCGRHAPLEVVRQLENDPKGYSEPLWAAMGDMGILGMRIPEQYGGAEMSLLDGVAVYEEFGRSLVASPHLVSSVLAAGLLVRAGTEEQKDTLLPLLAEGDVIITVAWLEPDSSYGLTGINLRAVPDGDGWALSGVKRHVAFAEQADKILVLALGPDGLMFFLVDSDAQGVSASQERTIGSDMQHLVRFNDVKVLKPDVVPASWEIWQDTMYDAATLIGAQAVGGAEAAFEITVEYAKTRHQFGKPLGAFQAIGHYLADRTTELDGAQTLVWEAAWARDSGRRVSRLAPMSKLFACKTFREVTATAQQIFGGNGFTLEYDVQLYFRRAKQLQLSWWDDRHLENLIAEDVFDAQEASV